MVVLVQSNFKIDKYISYLGTKGVFSINLLAQYNRSCLPKLKSYWAFDFCIHIKDKHTCTKYFHKCNKFGKCNKFVIGKQKLCLNILR